MTENTSTTREQCQAKVLATFIQSLNSQMESDWIPTNFSFYASKVNGSGTDSESVPCIAEHPQLFDPKTRFGTKKNYYVPIQRKLRSIIDCTGDTLQYPDHVIDFVHVSRFEKPTMFESWRTRIFGSSRPPPVQINGFPSDAQFDRQSEF
jgi:hypothetical protein